MRRVARAVVGTVSCVSSKQIDPLVQVSSRVYFIQHDEGAIKIGFSSAPERRMAELQVSLPGSLALLLTLDGGAELEAKLHKHFATDRIRGEWFRPSAALMAFIADPSLTRFSTKTKKRSGAPSNYARAGGVTQRQLRVFVAIARALQDGAPPSLRELRNTLHICEGTLREHTEALRKKGMIKKGPSRLARATAIAARGQTIVVRGDTVTAPLVRCRCDAEYPAFGACPFCPPRQGLALLASSEATGRSA